MTEPELNLAPWRDAVTAIKTKYPKEGEQEGV